MSVLGPSGCGKSTLLQLVAGLSQPTWGEILFRGEVIASPKRMAPPERRNVNMVFQDYALWPHMNVYDNIAYGLKRKRIPREEEQRRVKELIAMLRLSGLEKRLPPQLSGGQQQRVAIARALATRPALLLLDEPLSNLDMRLRIEMRTDMAYLFRKLGITVFHVTHDPDEAFAMADRLLIMRSGRIDQIGTPQECFSRSATRWAASLLGAINSLDGEVIETEKGTAVRVCSQTINGLDTGLVQFSGSGKVEVMCRPEDLYVKDQRGEEDSALLEARVLHCSFEGNKWRLIAETECGQTFYMLHDRPLDSGRPIRVGFLKQATFVYPVNGKGS